jgi:hypothetical protein
LKRLIVRTVEFVEVSSTSFFVFARLFANTALSNCKEQVLDLLERFTNPWVGIYTRHCHYRVLASRTLGVIQ